MNTGFTRRQFLTFVLIASALSFSSGCSRILKQLSPPLGPARQRTIKRVTERTPPTSTKGTTTTVPEAQEYDLAVVRGESPEAITRAAIRSLGGMEKFVKQDDLVVVKPNILHGSRPEYASTTNPEVVAAVVTMCYEAGAREVLVMDHSTSDQAQAHRSTGIGPAVEAAGGKMKVLTDRNFEMIEIPKGVVLKKWPLLKDAFEADVFINLPIAKDHGMAGLTMAMKNIMGAMGDPRGQIHINFHQKIVDVNTLFVPHLVILDAYRILVRNGPTGGDLKDVKLVKTVVAGTNSVSVDAYATRFFDMSPQDLQYLINASDQGLGEIDVSKLKIAEVST